MAFKALGFPVPTQRSDVKPGDIVFWTEGDLRVLGIAVDHAQMGALVLAHLEGRHERHTPPYLDYLPSEFGRVEGDLLATPGKAGGHVRLSGYPSGTLFVFTDRVIIGARLGSHHIYVDPATGSVANKLPSEDFEAYVNWQLGLADAGGAYPLGNLAVETPLVDVAALKI